MSTGEMWRLRGRRRTLRTRVTCTAGEMWTCEGCGGGGGGAAVAVAVMVRVAHEQNVQIDREATETAAVPVRAKLGVGEMRRF